MAKVTVCDGHCGQVMKAGEAINLTGYDEHGETRNLHYCLKDFSNLRITNLLPLKRLKETSVSISYE